MVMEAPPSPDSVGREFVRQYYTLLNKAPAHLHRFYNNQSSFVHGGLDPPNRETSPMIGQKQIHQKIQQLNFRDCHAKIAQVDAQATLGNGVVVQVTGELSNAGQPMRRFTQTFVLAAQSPKKYYVHNDIFRYQDEIISEEDCEPESRSDVEDEINQERPTLGDMPPINQQPVPPYYSPNAAPIQGTMPQVPPPHHHAQPPQHVLPPQPQSAPAPTVNGAIHPDEMNVMPPAQVPPHVTSPQAAPVMGAPLSSLQPTMPQIPLVVPMVDERPQQQPPIDEGAGDAPSENIYPDEPIQDDPQEVVQEPAAISNEPKTYATLLKSGNNVSNFNTSSQISAMPIQQQPSISPPPSNHFDSREMTPNQPPNQGLPLGQRNSINRNSNGARGNQVRPPRQDSRGGPGRLSLNEDDGRRVQGSAHGDNYQLFLGNLPHFATEEELREIFSEFGQIVDLRIHSKPNNKTGQAGGRVPPNYGFITYETQQGVQNCLAAKPHFFPKNDRYGQQLNVEEKKTKDRPFGGGGGGGGGRPSGDNNGGPRPRDNGQRRGPGGPGVNRGGGAGGPGIPGGQTNRPSSFNRGGGGGGPPNRGPNNTYNNRR